MLNGIMPPAATARISHPQTATRELSRFSLPPTFTLGSKLHHGARRKPLCWIVRLERGKGLWCGVVMMVGEFCAEGQIW
jgi:hypothetical protein